MSKDEQNQITYADSGVNIEAGAKAVDLIKESVHRTYRPEVVGDIGGFGGVFSAKAFKDMEEPLLVSGTDGVGTKLALAQKLDNHSTVGQDLVAMCANDILALGAEPLFFLDYIAIGKLDPSVVSVIVSGIADGCKLAGCALIGGEMAEHPGTMAAKDYDLSGFCVGVVDKPHMLNPNLVKEGDTLIGVASSGIHSNGFSLVRRALTDELTVEELRAPQERLNGESLADALLKPTKIYIKPALEVLDTLGKEHVHGFAHITGGGITENINRILPDNLDAQITLGSWEVKSIIEYVVQAANLTQEEAYKTFNMGIGLCVACTPESADKVINIFETHGDQAWQIGEVVQGIGEVKYK